MTRLEKFREVLEESGLDGFLITQPDNRRYLSGFTGSNGVLIITAEKQVLATDSRYYTQVREQCPDWELAEVGYSFPDHMLELLRGLELGARKVGFEADHITVSTLYSWERALLGRLMLVNTEGVVASLRMQKDADEVAAIKKAVALADAAVQHITRWMKPGMTELQVAWELERYLRTSGADALAFESIVASGPNSAKPHARPTERQIQAGEPITLDLGCVIDGYCSDVTRTVSLGEPRDDKYLTVWHTVREALETATRQAKGGMTGEAVDKLARDVIDQAGYKDYFGHGLGHGVGLSVHEGPRYSFTYPHEVPSGAVMTIEPGIYIPEWGGVRLEDMVVVGDEGVEVLTGVAKEAVVALA
ncbi:MAG: Xaa-Pro peptidase family protein [Anaerolineae bacterium]|nr:Xaa-Pro peptidase family protein [Anaerolineae bacterium]